MAKSIGDGVVRLVGVRAAYSGVARFRNVVGLESDEIPVSWITDDILVHHVSGSLLRGASDGLASLLILLLTVHVKGKREG